MDQPRIEEGPVAVRFTYETGGTDRPRKSAPWWREVRRCS